MNILESFRLFVKNMTGQDVGGINIANAMQEASTVVSKVVVYGDDDKKTLILNSSTASSDKQFSITVTDDGTITATEV